MTIILQDIQDWLSSEEDEHLEFKEARSRFDFELLVKYCAALANGGGGQMILGVTDQKPRKVVGSQAFQDIGDKDRALVSWLRRRINCFFCW